MSDEVLVLRESPQSNADLWQRAKAPLQALPEWTHGLPLVLLFVALWELLPRLGLIDRMFLPTFSDTLQAWGRLALSGRLFVDLAASLERALLGFLLAMLVSVPLGFLMGWYRSFERYTDLLIQGLRNTSTFALMPIFLLLFGLGEGSKVAIIFYSASWHILINTIAGVKEVDPIYIKAARSMGLSDKDIFRKVILPAAVPSIVSGARLGVKIALMVVIAVEMIGAKSGLGFFIQNAEFNFLVPDMYAGVLTLALLGLLINYLLVWFEHKATYWKRDTDSAQWG